MRLQPSSGSRHRFRFPSLVSASPPGAPAITARVSFAIKPALQASSKRSLPPRLDLDAAIQGCRRITAAPRPMTSWAGRGTPGCFRMRPDAELVPDHHVVVVIALAGDDGAAEEEADRAADMPAHSAGSARVEPLGRARRSLAHGHLARRTPGSRRGKAGFLARW